MERIYPHLDNTDYPNLDQVDVWRFRNDFDYSKYDGIQMKITVCTVPWDVGLIHVGNAQIRGFGNVVYFEDKTARNAYFDGIPDDKKFVFNTPYRRFHSEGEIEVPLPYDVVARFNYIVVEYETPLPVEFEGDGMEWWGYFIREFHMKAPSNTLVTIIADLWQDYIYDIEIPYMMLERGHAPMAAIDADTYLENPLDNTRYLVGDDVVIESGERVAYDTEYVFNAGDNVYACFVLDVRLNKQWGDYESTWRMPRMSNITVQGTSAYACYALPAAQMNSFLSSVDSSYPQFKQAVKAIFFATEKTISLGVEEDFAGYTFNRVNATSNRVTEILSLDKTLFDYGPKYERVAKLYTYPYAHIELMDENGNGSVIRIEDTSGKLDIAFSQSIVFPFLRLTANVLGVGGNAHNIYFRNIATRAFKFGGKWQEHVFNWDVPTFEIFQSNDITNDYATHFDRAQMKTAADNAYTSSMASNATAYNNSLDSNATANANALASNATAKTNSDIMAQAAKTVADRTADTSVTNCATQVAANTAITNTERAANNATNRESNALNTSSANLGNNYTNSTTNNEINAEYDAAAVSAVGNIAGSVMSGASSGMVAGPVGAGAGAVAGLVGGAVQTAMAYAQLSITANLKSAQAALSTGLNSAKTSETNSTNTVLAGITNDVKQSNNSTSNNAMTATTAASAATVKNNASTMQGAANSTSSNTKATDDANANRTKATDDANAGRTKITADANAGRTRDTAYSAIDNQIKQARLKPTNVFGEISNAETATTRPMALFAQVVTQSDGAIAAAGDEMLRFGYHCPIYWEFDGFNKMKHFTYWKVKDMAVHSLTVPDAYMDAIRFALMGGCCVWRNPDDIGIISIYDNMPD